MNQDSTHVYGGDLETDNNGSRAWLVQWAISDSVSEVHGRTWDGFISTCQNLMTKGEVYIYFHNLNYDGNFLKYPLKEWCDTNKFELFVIKRSSSLVMMKITPPKESGLHTLNIRDSSKKLSGSPPLYMVAKFVGLEKLEGFDFYPGWSDKVDFSKSENWNYVDMDARIVATIVRQIHGMGLTNPTISGDAWRLVKSSFGYFNFEKYFPSLDYETDGFLRNAYSGGINISQHKGLNKGKLLHADVHSMYPSVMMYDPLPILKPTKMDEQPDTLYVVRGLFKLRLRDGMIPWFRFKRAADYWLEDIELDEPVTKTDKWHLLTLTNVELELLEKWYHVEKAYDDSDDPAIFYAFNSCIGALEPYITEQMDKKSKAVKGTLDYLMPKYMMNTPYGRFGLNPDMESTSLVWENDKLVWKQTKTVMQQHDAYLPMAEFVTAHAKRRLLDYVAKVGCDKVIHCDTDSVIHKGREVKGIDYGDNLGQWGIEARPLKIYEGGFKRYIEILEHDEVWSDKKKWLSMACAGVPNKKTSKDVPVGMWIELLDNPEKILSDDELGHKEYRIESKWLRKLYQEHNMNPDKVNTMKLIPRHVPGGVILEERNHKLCDPLQFRWRH